MNVNKAIVIGGVTRNPESRVTTKGISVVNFGIATNRKNGEVKVTEFHNIVAFGKLADSVTLHLKTGMTAFVEGHIQTRAWEADGKKNYRTEIMAESVRWIWPDKDEPVIDLDAAEEPEPVAEAKPVTEPAQPKPLRSTSRKEMEDAAQRAFDAL